MAKRKKVKVIWKTIRGTSHSVMIDEGAAQAYMDRLRSLPEVKASSVRLSL